MKIHDRITELRERFTKWYYRKGYRTNYDFSISSFNDFRVVFKCPFWLRPIVPLLFSPSVYYYEAGKEICNWFEYGMNSNDIKLKDYIENGGKNENS